jgi:DNA-binding GntR family transcriptional regulator
LKDADSNAIETPSLVESVRERLIGDIMERRYLPGQKLPILEISARYGVSETPVKQAFNRLVSEGMLVSLPRRGVVVRRVSEEDVREIMEARQMVYLASVDAALAVSAERRKNMRERLSENLSEHLQLLDDVTDPLKIEAYLHYAKIDREYHTVYLECINNRTIDRFFHQLDNQAYGCVSSLSFSTFMMHRIRHAFDDHTSIFDAWASGERNRMIDALKLHKDGAIRTLSLIFEHDR